MSKLAHRYAQALLMAVEKHNPQDLEQTNTALTNFAAAWQSNEEFRELMQNPLVPMLTRRELLDQALTVLKFPQELNRFLNIVFERNRVQLLPEMAICFSALVDRRNQVVDVKITSAFTLSEVEMQKVARTVQKKITGTPRYQYCQDSSLIGGLVIEYEGKLLDGSIRTRLKQLEKELTQ